MSEAVQQRATPEPEVSAIVDLHDVGVRYNVPIDRIRSFKEYFLRRLSGGLEYRELWALHSVRLEVKPGEVFGVVGRNGAGKSTLLKVISRVLRPTTGRVIVRGTVAPLLELGAGFHPDLTGRENVFLNASILGHPQKKMRDKLEETIAFAGLENFIDSPIRTYSTGMQARLGFAVATTFRPDVLLLDEVLAVGDLSFQQKCFDRIASFRERGTTVLLVSHSLSAIRDHCDRVAWLEDGSLAALGVADEVISAFERAML